MSFNRTFKPIAKKDLAQRFGKQLEEHIAFGQKLAKNISNFNTSQPIATDQIIFNDSDTKVHFLSDQGKEISASAFVDNSIENYDTQKSSSREQKVVIKDEDIQDVIQSMLSTGSMKNKHDTLNIQEVREAFGIHGSIDDKGLAETSANTNVVDNTTIEESSSKEASFREKVAPKDNKAANKNEKKGKNEKIVEKVSHPVISSLEKQINSIGSKKLSQVGSSKNKKNLEILNNSHASLEKSSARGVADSQSILQRPETTKTECESLFSRSDSKKSMDMSVGSIKTDHSKKPEVTSYLYPNLEKRTTFKKKIIQDSMQRLKGGSNQEIGPTDKSEEREEHEIALKQLLANTSLTFESAEYIKSSEDSFQMRDRKDTNHTGKSTGKGDAILERLSHQDQRLKTGESNEAAAEMEHKQAMYNNFEHDLPLKIVEGEDGDTRTVIPLRELIKHRRRGSQPNMGHSPRSLQNAIPNFRLSEPGNHGIRKLSMGEDESKGSRRLSVDMDLGEEDHTHNAAAKEDLKQDEQKKDVHEETTWHNNTKNEDPMAELDLFQSGDQEDASAIEDITKQRILQFQGKIANLHPPEIKEEMIEESERTTEPSQVLRTAEDKKIIDTPVFQTRDGGSSKGNRFFSTKTVGQSESTLYNSGSDGGHRQGVDSLKKKIHEKVLNQRSKSSSKNGSLNSIGSPRSRSSHGGREDLIALGARKYSEGLEKELTRKLMMKTSVLEQNKSRDSGRNEHHEAMGFLSFSKDSGRPDGIESMQSLDYSSLHHEIKRDGHASNEKPTSAEKMTNAMTFQSCPKSVEDDNQQGQRQRAQEEFDVAQVQETQLNEAATKVNIKTFLALKSILKPHKSVTLCGEGLLKLFSGVEGVSEEFVSKNTIDWNQTKTALNSPIKLVNLVTSYKNLVRSGRITRRNINALKATLSKIGTQKDIPLQEAFNQIHGFLTSAVDYYEKTVIEAPDVRRPTLEEPETNLPIPEEYTHHLIENRTKAIQRDLKSRNSSEEKPVRTVHSKAKSALNSPAKKGLRGLAARGIEKARTSSNVLKKEVSVQNIKKEKVIRRDENQYRPNVTVSLNTSPLKKSGLSSKQTSAKKYKYNHKNQSFQEDGDYDEFYDEMDKDEMEKEEVMFILDVQQSEAERLIDEIDIKERENRNYRGKVKKMLSDHERFVKRFMKQQQDLEDEMNREHNVQNWRNSVEFKNRQEAMEKDWRHNRNMAYINDKKDTKNKQKREEKENLNEELLESLHDHYFHTYVNQKKQQDKQKDLRARYKSVLADKLNKKQKEVNESISLKQDLTDKRLSHFKSRRSDVDSELKKWQGDYLMLSNLIGNAK